MQTELNGTWPPPGHFFRSADQLMARCLFTVDHTLMIDHRGLFMFPGIVPDGDEVFHVGDLIVLRKPDSTSIDARIAGLELAVPNPLQEVIVMLADLTKDDVPLGTEVWSSDT